ncbi:MAG: transglutaminase family protein [Bacteroidetes bacterium]|nr:transglutaminase family protein [Bacteroidota bacterium]MBK8657866.1 transglutaminase family protein [Bacteroidota bacterium]
MPRFILEHLTKYTYPSPVKNSANKIMLFPIADEYQELVKQKLIITGNPLIETYRDYYGNEVGSFTYTQPHLQLSIESKIEVVTKKQELPKSTLSAEEQWETLKKAYHNSLLIDYLKQEEFDKLKEVEDIVKGLHLNDYDTLKAVEELNKYVYSNFKYIKGITEVDTTLDEVWKLKAGVCQDFAHILLVTLRMTGIPARYVSGYVCPISEGYRGEGATHAWVEAYLPELGWVGFDPTNNCIVSDLHIRLAVGRSFRDCSPVRGTYVGTSNHELEVKVNVSYQDGHSFEESNTSIVHPVKEIPVGENSYRTYMQMIQQQQ